MASQAARQPLRQASRAASTSAASTTASSGAFFPVQASPSPWSSAAAAAVPKPPSQEWYTGRPTYTSTQAQLERALTAARAHLYRQGLLKSISSSTGHDAEFYSVLPHPRERKWKQAKDMATYLRTGAQLKSSQYKRLTATLANLEGLLPYARVADSLTESDSLATPPKLVVDPVARATGRQDATAAAAEPEAAAGESSTTSLYSQLDQLLSRFQHVSASGSSAVQRSLGKARRLGERDEFGRVMASGARKEAGARVWIIPTSEAKAAAAPSAHTAAEEEYAFGRVVVNAKSLPDYFPAAAHREAVVRPMSLVSALGAFNVFAIVKGSGVAAQADAVALALARALAEWERIEVEEGRRHEGVVSWRDILKRGAFGYFLAALLSWQDSRTISPRTRTK
jgi:small subunit ribosomal protein S9